MYRFDAVAVDDIETDEISVKNVELERMPDGDIMWQYGNKIPVRVREDGVYVKEDKVSDEARKQAYFALSILDDHGYVLGFRKT
jgi:hypothetical protein